MASVYAGDFPGASPGVTPSWASIADSSTQAGLAGKATIVTSKVTGSGTATAAPFVNTTHFTWQQLKPPKPVPPNTITGQDRAEYQGNHFNWATGTNTYENTLQAVAWAVYLPSKLNQIGSTLDWNSNWAAVANSIHYHPVLWQPWARGVGNGNVNLHPPGYQGASGPSITWAGIGGQTVGGSVGQTRMAVATDWRTLLPPSAPATLQSQRFPQIAGPNTQTGVSFPLVFDTWMEFVFVQFLTTTGGNGYYQCYGQVYGSGVPWVKVLDTTPQFSTYNTVGSSGTSGAAPAHGNAALDYHRFGGYVYNLPQEIDFAVGGFHTYNGATAVADAQAAFTAETASGVPVSSVAPTVSGLAPFGSTLTTTNGTWTNSPTSFTYQWTRAGSNISSATSSTYATVSADVGNAVGCKVVAINGTGSSTATASSNTITVTGVPVNTVAPVASGTATVGSTISTTVGTWTNSPTFTYQWTRDGTNLGGATSNTYVAVTGDATHAVGCTVTATNSTGSTPQASNAITIAPTAGAPVNSAVPTVSGLTAIGSTLATTNGSWSNTPTSFTYQWTRDGANISAATASTYTTVTADSTHAVGCKVTATNASGSGTQASGNTVTVTPIAPVNTVTPAVTGTPAVGSVLTTDSGTWTGTATITFAYQWQRFRDGPFYIPITSATSTTYTLVDADDGCQVRCNVRASNSAGTIDANSNSLAVTEPVPVNSVAPVVGSVDGTFVLSNPGTWSNLAGLAGASFTYQWTRDGVAIPGGTDTIYTAIVADQGHSLACAVAAINSGGTSVFVPSNATAIPVGTDAPFPGNSLFPDGGISLVPESLATLTLTPVVPDVALFP